MFRKMSLDNQLPKYICHKKVRGGKIANIEKLPGNQYKIIFEKDTTIKNYMIFEQEFITRHKPVDGGYIVVYEDGYTSFSPEKAFEEGYSLYSVEATQDRQKN